MISPISLQIYSKRAIPPNFLLCHRSFLPRRTPPFCVNIIFKTLFGIWRVGKKGLSLLCKQGRTARAALPSFLCLETFKEQMKISSVKIKIISVTVKIIL
ncbi:MAG: hypothetical protein MSH66_06395 [Bacteroidales bacterium]|nr:hypothetical protein [Bacteroidales bacterium]